MSRKSGALTYPEPLGPPRPVAGWPLALSVNTFWHQLRGDFCLKLILIRIRIKTFKIFKANSQAHILYLTHSYSVSHSLIFCISLIHILYLTHSYSVSHSLIFCISLTHILYFTHSYSVSHSLIFCISLTHSYSVSHSLIFCISLTHILYLTHSLPHILHLTH